jgi:hypothetical protein
MDHQLAKADQAGFEIREASVMTTPLTCLLFPSALRKNPPVDFGSPKSGSCTHHLSVSVWYPPSMPRKPTGRPVGRPTAHTAELAEAIAIRIASGESLGAIC